MNLQPLKWTRDKLPSRQEHWSYQAFGVDHGFPLRWQGQADNAHKPARGDLLLLRQHGYVTHLVEFLDTTVIAERADTNGYKSRLVEVLWVMDWTQPQSAPKATQLFDFPEVMYWQGDDAMYLPALPSFQRRWAGSTGLQDWQAHVHTQLQLD